MSKLEQLKNSLVEEVEKRVIDKIIEPSNAALLIKLINNAENEAEALAIAELGTTYRRTGLHFDKRLEKIGSDIKYLVKNKDLSFVSDENALTHKLIIGDNYDALQNLLINYKGLVNVIYIDPPYSKDNMGKFADTNYTNALTRDNLLSMLYPRLQLAKQLLAEDGIIFCSIDEKNESYVKCLFDEIFDEQNFRSLITVVANPGGRDYGGIAKTTEFVLVYARSPETIISKIASDTHKFKMADNIGPFELRELRNRNTKFNDQNRHNLCYPFYVDENDIDEHGLYNISLEPDEKHTIEVMPLVSQGIQTVWRWGKEERSRKNLNINIKAKKKTDGTFMIVEKYRDECVMLKNIWTEKNVRTESGSLELKSIMGGKVFDYPKPVEIPYKILKATTHESSIILDFFAGSGTTGQATLKLNNEDGGSRQFILCTNNEITDMNPNGIAYDVTSKRLKRVMTGSCYDGDNSFEWLNKNEPFGDNLDVFEIELVNNSEKRENKSAFEVIDETLYDIPKFSSIEEKINWVCSNFENTQKYIKGE